MRNWRSVLAIGAVAWAVACGVQAGLKVGQPAPDFSVTTFGGHAAKLADFKGDVIILNFWATWCAPCRLELPLLEVYFETYNKYGFQVLAVATEDSISERQLRPLAEKLKIPFVRRLKGPYHAFEGVPTNYIIDRSGRLVYAKSGAFDLDELNEIVLPLLKEPIPETVPTAPSPGATGPKPASTP
jgi:cytochrome c biogenesis protein CcmG/thiol:disulfide interchange protein DsbE